MSSTPQPLEVCSGTPTQSVASSISYLQNPQLVKAAAAAFDEDICGGNYGGVSDQMTKVNYLLKWANTAIPKASEMTKVGEA